MAIRKKISMKEFVEAGYLQEANRQFFHVLGLSMEVKKTGDKYEFDGIWDFRDIKGGIRFGDDIIQNQDFVSRTNNIKEKISENKSLRKQLYNEITQSVPTRLGD